MSAPGGRHGHAALARAASGFDPTETSNLITSEAGWVPFLTRRPIEKW
jgi:hypothetical protein